MTEEEKRRQEMVRQALQGIKVKPAPSEETMPTATETIPTATEPPSTPTEAMQKQQSEVMKALQGVGVRPNGNAVETGTGVGTEAKATAPVTDYDYLQQFTDEYTPKPLTADEIQKRTRIAHAIEGIGSIGNAANAISNLIFTSQGAPSQKLPTNVDASAAIAKLEEKERAKRNEIYQRAKDRIAQQLAQDNMTYQKQKDAQDFKMKAGEFQIKLNELELKRQEAERKGDLDAARLLKEQALAVKAQQDALYAPQRHKAYIGAQNASANRSNAAATAEKGMQSIPYHGAEGLATFKVKKDDWNNATLLGAFADALDLPITWDKPVKKDTSMADLAVLLGGGKLPDDQAAGGTITTPDGIKTYYTKEQLQMIIGEALNDPANAVKVQSLIDLYEGRKPKIVKYTGPKRDSGAEEEEPQFYE